MIQTLKLIYYENIEQLIFSFFSVIYISDVNINVKMLIILYYYEKITVQLMKNIYIWKKLKCIYLYIVL